MRVQTPGRANYNDELSVGKRHGDRRAFEALVGRHKGALFGLVRRYLGNADDACDLLQDTLISV